jgi:hypothetical protein
MEAVGILGGRDAVDHEPFVYVLGQGELDEDPVNRRVRVEAIEQRQELVLRSARLEVVVPRGDADLGAGASLGGDVDARGRILADEDRGEPRDDPARAQPGDLLRHLGAHLRGDRLAVDEPRGHVSGENAGVR